MMSRSDVAKKFNVSYETIRNWEKKGILKTDCITPTGRKYFSEEQVNALYAGTINSCGKSD